MPGARDEGNHVIAVYVSAWVDVYRAHAGYGPSLFEAVTYRLGPHTPADDPGRYRKDDEVAAWEELDPLVRVRRLLERSGAWTESWQQSLETEASNRIEEAVAWAESVPELEPDDMFKRMFAEPTPNLVEQEREATGRG